ncbi:MAG: class B sortase [Lachnospiraceae bacterium]|nr:class B sortase [Lachnospiraceae bacterium]
MDKKRIANIVIPVVLVLIIGVALYKVITIQMEYREAEDEYSDLAAYVVEEPIESVAVQAETPDAAAETLAVLQEEGVLGAEDISEEPAENRSTDGEQRAVSPNGSAVVHIDDEALRGINEDYRAWLRIPALRLSYPLVEGPDNDYYLHYTFEKKYNAAGCLFIDYETASDFSDRNTFIYGHNMKNGSMFGCLKRFRKEQGLCASDPYFYIYRGGEVYQYEIFAYYTTEYTSDRYRLIYTEEEYDNYIADALRLTEYIPVHELDFSERPNIVTLSTCAGTYGTTERMVVHGVLVGVSEAE